MTGRIQKWRIILDRGGSEFELTYRSIGDAGATQLADALRTNTSVKKLYPAPTPAMR